MLEQGFAEIDGVDPNKKQSLSPNKESTKTGSAGEKPSSQAKKTRAIK